MLLAHLLPAILHIACLAHTATAARCPHNQYYITKLDTCQPVTPCRVTEYEAAPPTATTDLSCKPLCDWRSSFLSAPASPTTDAACQRLTQCSTFIATAPTPTTDRQCSRFPAGVNVTGPVYVGTLTNPSLQLLEQYSAVTGAIELLNFENSTFVAPALKYLGQGLIISGVQNLTIISMPDMLYMGGLFGYDGATAARSDGLISIFNAPKLTVIVGFLLITNGKGTNPALTYINFNALSYVSQELHVESSTMLTIIELSSLSYVGNFVKISSHLAVTAVDMPRLTIVGSYINIYVCAALVQLVLPSLTCVFGYFRMYDNQALTYVSLPSLTYIGDYLNVFSNFALTSITAPALMQISCLEQSCIINECAVYLCDNDAFMTLSSSIETAAAGQRCFLTQSCESSSVCMHRTTPSPC